MSDEREPLPHQLMFDCVCLLQELREKYPDSLLSIFSRLIEIKKEYELYERIENETSEQKEERKKLALFWLDKWKLGRSNRRDKCTYVKEIKDSSNEVVALELVISNEDKESLYQKLLTLDNDSPLALDLED